LFNRKKLLLMLLVICIVLIGSFGWYQINSKASSKGFIEASGFIEGNQIVLSAQIPGIVVEVNTEEGQWVKKGQKVVRLDDLQLSAKVDQARAQLDIASAQVKQADAQLNASFSQKEQAQLSAQLADKQSVNNVNQAEAAYQAAKANEQQALVVLEKAQDDFSRYKDLFDNKAVSVAEFEAVKKQLNAVDAKYVAAQQQAEQAASALQSAKDNKMSADVQHKVAEGTLASYSQAQAGLETAIANQQLAQAALKEAEALLDRTKVLAPSGGVILNTLVNQGELVASGTPLIQLVNMHDLFLTVYVTGQDIGKIKLGQRARVTIDAFSDKTFAAKVARVAQQAEFTPKNVHMPNERAKLVYAVELNLDNSEGFLKPGMPADAEILLVTDQSK